jgi:hypothetical protein
MTTAGLVVERPVEREGARRTASAVIVLQLFALTILLFPSDTVIKPIGANGYVASLVALTAFGLWAVAIILGFHDPRRYRSPIRVVVSLLWLASLVSYMAMNRQGRSVAEVLSADRWLIQLVAVTGVILVAAEFLGSLDDVKRVLRALVTGGGVCGAIAALQYWFSLDLSSHLRSLPGFSPNANTAAITARDSLARVAGTAIHPIELGVVAGMLLPLALYLALYDRERPPLRRWVPVLGIFVAIPASVSRSGVIAVVVAIAFFLVMLPPIRRVVGLLFAPLALAMVFMAAPGIIGTLTSLFSAGTSDRSVSTRVDDLSLVEGFVSHAPLWGRGGGTYFARNALEILDNQYYKTAIELGLVGLVVVILYFAMPVIIAVAVHRRSSDPDLRTLCGALAGAAAAALVCSATFDSFSFPMFTGVSALVIGLIGAVWRLQRTTNSLRGAS